MFAVDEHLWSRKTLLVRLHKICPCILFCRYLLLTYKINLQIWEEYVSDIPGILKSSLEGFGFWDMLVKKWKSLAWGSATLWCVEEIKLNFVQLKAEIFSLLFKPKYVFSMLFKHKKLEMLFRRRKKMGNHGNFLTVLLQT